jgi:PAS domain S-box-containing protein
MSGQKQIEVQLNESEQMNRLLFDLSSDKIIKLSPELKIVEFNTEAGKFFSKKREDMLDQNFIQSFVPEPERKRTEKELKKLFAKAQDSKFRLKVIADGDQILDVEWSANLILNDQKIPIGLILISKNQ